MENSNIILNALGYIQKETKRADISIEDVAVNAGFSVDYFNRIFLRHTGFSVMEYIRFTRLKKASFLLRTSESNILDIALDVGYDSHESFSRAFKKQYGKTPREYRESMKNTPVRYGYIANDTTSSRFMCEFPAFHQIDSDEAIDCLIEKNPKKWGAVSAIIYNWNGTKFFTDKDSNCEDFIAVDEFQAEKFFIEILSGDIEKIIRYYKLFMNISDNISFFSDLSDGEIISAFERSEINVNEIRRRKQYIYTGEGVETEELDLKLKIKRLEKCNLDDIRKWADEYGNDWKITESISKRENFGHVSVDIPYGIYVDEKMIGVFRTMNYELRGMIFCEMEGECILKKHSSDSLSRYVYIFILNEEAKSGKVIFDCTSDSSFLEKLGFENVNDSISVKFN